MTEAAIRYGKSSSGRATALRIGMSVRCMRPMQAWRYELRDVYTRRGEGLSV